MKITRNKEGVVFNKYQGAFGKALCVCSAGVLRSPTLAEILISQGWNARACGAEDYALIRVSAELVAWADEIFCMTWEQQDKVETLVNATYEPGDGECRPLVRCLNVEDEFEFRDPKLIQIFKDWLENER
jgi:predicted protein tyrosine phosphatase